MRHMNCHSRLSVSCGIVVLPLVLLLVATGSIAETRPWSSASGAYKTEAELVQLKDDGTVVLKTKAGKTVEVPLSKLSAADQAYARSQSAKSPPPQTDSE